MLPGVGWWYPEVQFWQALESDVWPAAAPGFAFLPLAQPVQEDLPVAAWKRPAAHEEQFEAKLAAANVPCLQAVQLVPINPGAQEIA